MLESPLPAFTRQNGQYSAFDVVARVYLEQVNCSPDM